MFAVSGCATIGTEITKANNHVRMPGYSVVIPPDQGWHLQQDDARESARLIKKVDPIIWQMWFFRNTINSDALMAATAKEVADHFRQLDIQVMIEEGVKKGKYQLRDVTMGEETVGDRSFYTMEHSIITAALFQRMNMYLHFPRARNNRHFFVAHYSEATPPGVTAKSYKNEFLRVLTTLDFK
jgi:hypothetical protein